MRTPARDRGVGLMLLAIVVAACARAAAPTALAPSATSAPCPTTPYSWQRPPDPLTAAFTQTWFGNAALWAGLAPLYQGHWYAGPDGLKVLWYRLVAGRLTVTGQRLDGPAPALQADIPGGYGDTSYQASGLIFPMPGCWEVVGAAGGQELRFVVLVHPASENPVKLAGGTARKAGWVELYDFIERGYEAFRRIKDVKAFVTTVEQRERRVLDQIFAGLPDPLAT